VEKSGRMCYACGALPRSQWSRSKHFLLSADDTSVMDCQRKQNNAVSALLPPQYGTHSLLAFTLVLHHMLSVVFLKPTFRSGPQFPLAAHTNASGSDFGRHCTIKDFIYLLTYFQLFHLTEKFYKMLAPCID